LDAHSFSQQRIAFLRFFLKIVGIAVGLEVGLAKIFSDITDVYRLLAPPSLGTITPFRPV